MRNKNLILGLMLIGFFIACKTQTDNKVPAHILKLEKEYDRIDSLNKILNWEELNCGLWINKNNEIGFQVKEQTYYTAEITNYTTQLWVMDSIVSFNSFVDTSSFKKLGMNFYTDVNHIYYYNAMSDGGDFSLNNDLDKESFVIINSCYAKDKNHIYDNEGNIIEEADIKTFKTNSSIKGCHAKDKNYFYKWGDTITSEDMKDSLIIKAIETLNK